MIDEEEDRSRHKRASAGLGMFGTLWGKILGTLTAVALIIGIAAESVSLYRNLNQPSPSASPGPQKAGSPQKYDLELQRIEIELKMRRAAADKMAADACKARLEAVIASAKPDTREEAIDLIQRDCDPAYAVRAKTCDGKLDALKAEADRFDPLASGAEKAAQELVARFATVCAGATDKQRRQAQSIGAALADKINKVNKAARQAEIDSERRRVDQVRQAAEAERRRIEAEIEAQRRQAEEARLAVDAERRRAAEAAAEVERRRRAEADRAADARRAATITFHMFDNYDMLGNDIETLKDTSAEACREACRGNALCAAYSFDKWNKWCFIKGATSELVYTARSQTALRDTAPSASFSSLPITFERFRNRTFPRPSGGSPVRSFEHCEALCGQSDTCAAATYVKSSSICVMYGSTLEYVPDRNADSAAKRQAN